MGKTDELLATLLEHGCCIYGAGYVANLLFAALENRGLMEKVRCCIVSGTPEKAELHGVPVVNVDAWLASGGLSTDEQLLLCVHPAILDEVRGELERRGIQRGIEVYPLLHELLFGPVLYSKRVRVAEILKAQPEEYRWLETRAAGLSAFGEAGAKAYVECMSQHCSRGTAEKRLAAFRSRSVEVCNDTACMGDPILLDEDLRVIDGLHRLVHAWAGNAVFISADIVAANMDYDRLYSESNTLPNSATDALKLSNETRQVLEDIHEQMEGTYSMEARNPRISVILPVYNVEEYIDQCMESLVSQTYADFEALLINDGSTDGSLAKCRQWEERDNRIICIDKPNGGVSSARNLGIEQAKGEYLAFVDPDDWLDERYLEVLYTRAEETGADFVECDLWRYDNRNGTKIHRYCGQRAGVPYTLTEHMKYGPTASYKALSKRALWIENDLRFPDCTFESPAIYALVLALAEKVDYIPEPLYYYRRFRENSLVETSYSKAGLPACNDLGVEAMEYLVGQFASHGLLDKYAKDLPGIVIYRLNDILAMQYHRKAPEDFRELVANYRQLIARTLPQSENAPYITWGGYNSDKICGDMAIIHDPDARFNFSSLVSLLGPDEPKVAITHKNRYRQMMITREMKRYLPAVLERDNPGYLVLDFIEERFDILAWRGRYLTASDALEGAEGIDLSGCRRIPRFSSECDQLFEEAVLKLKEELDKHAPGIKVLLVENYLSETVGDFGNQTAFEGLENIRKVNRLLNGYYNYAQSVLPGCVRIPAFQCEDYFTDAGYEYGAVPSHLNAIVNERIAQLIEKEMS